jgi:hypothetical protein
VPRTKSTINDEQTFPLWFNLPRRFYERLAAAHEEFGVSRTKLMMRGLELAIKEEEAKRAGKAPNTKRAPVSDESLSDALRRVAEMRWQAASEEERKQVGRKLAEARWGKKRTKKTGKP